ncbi:MAG: hypothetical protein HOZ81_09430 [Streptomyces sp.]|nr:hypothetical protein [Streptomyces sp.]NUP38994.1 hypothetical protein [Streptomyces sp.]NUS30945.1 hypothetical protein [Streptomyces sp.]
MDVGEHAPHLERRRRCGRRRQLLPRRGLVPPSLHRSVPTGRETAVLAVRRGQPGRRRLDAFSWYKANWATTPTLHITSRRWTRRTDAHTELKVYSNADEVTATLNGTPLGTLRSGDRIFRWTDVTLRAGENTVAVTATINGSTHTDTVVWTLAADTAPATPNRVGLPCRGGHHHTHGSSTLIKVGPPDGAGHCPPGSSTRSRAVG